MNDIDKMPSKCHDCPYWEACDYPYICPDVGKHDENSDINREFAENPQNRPTDGLIWKQAALDAVNIANDNGQILTILDVLDVIKALPTVQPDEKLERCLFEYINACRTANCPTPDTTRKDRRDAYAVIKALQPIFGDMPF